MPVLKGTGQTPRRIWVSVVCWILAGFFMVWAILRIGALERGFPLVQLIAYTPYGLLLSLLALLLVVLCRRWLAAGFLLLAVIALALAVLPREIGDPEQVPGGRSIRILTANLAKGKADSVELVALAEARDVDLVFLQEVSAVKALGLEQAGLSAAYPHHVLDVTERDGGGAIWSRWPLHRLPPLTVGHQPRAAVEVPDSIPIEVVSVHPTAPMRPASTTSWEKDFEAFPAAFSSQLPLVLAGDFNATLDHSRLRELIDTGYRDAAEVVGDGLVTTWPSTLRWPPPVTIDHVLPEKGIGFSEYDVEKIRGSDHRAVFAELKLPPVPEQS